MTVRPGTSRSWLVRSMLSLGAVGAVLALVRCFNPALPTCSYRCDVKNPSCPPEYECRSDSICHIKGSTEACSFSFDLASSTLDFATPPDQASPSDMAPADM